MFRCSICKTPSPRRVKPVIVPVKTQAQTYRHYRDDEPVVTFGHETVTEGVLCSICAGVPSRREAKTDMTPSIRLGISLQTHANGCDGFKTRTVDGVKVKEPCMVCARNYVLFGSIPAPAINKVLSEPQVHTGRSSIAALVLDSMIRRTTEQVRNGVQGRRAKMDFLAAYPVLKGFEERGGRL